MTVIGAEGMERSPRRRALHLDRHGAGLGDSEQRAERAGRRTATSWHAHRSHAMESDEAVPGWKEEPVMGTSGAGHGPSARWSRWRVAIRVISHSGWASTVGNPLCRGGPGM